MKTSASRRQFLTVSGLGLLGTALTRRPQAAAVPAQKFTFAHLTDSHITTDRRGDAGVAQCINHVNRLNPDFVLTGGDQLMDIMGTDHNTAVQLFDLWEARAKDLQAPVHHVMGNHDVFGISAKNTGAHGHPEYGREMFKDRMGQGKSYYSFDHKGWHFIVLDSIGVPPERGYIGDVDAAQMDWLKADLERTGKETPMIVTTHIPLLTLSSQVQRNTWEANSKGLVIGNGRDIRLLLEQYKVKMVLQGHIHIIEQMEFNGIQYITSGAVCGNWWRGPRFTFPEGYAVITCEGETAKWEYKSFGWKAAAEGD